MRKAETLLLDSEELKNQWKVSCHEMWQDIFGDSDAYMDYYERYKWHRNFVFLLAKADILCSMLHLNPYQIREGELDRELHYIVGVCTREEMRGRGYMRTLLQEMFRYLYQKGEPWTYLMPAAQAIYEPYDFCPVSWVQPREVRFYREERTIQEKEGYGGGWTDCMESRGGTRERVLSYEECSRTERRALENFAEHCLSKYYCVYAVHHESYFAEIAAELRACGGGLIVLEEEGEIIGYAEYMYDEGEEIPVEVAEIVFADGKREVGFRMFGEYLLGVCGEEVLRVLFTESAFLPKSFWEKGLDGGDGQSVRGLMGYPKKCQIMARVLDFRQAAQTLKRPEGWAEHVCCQISDSFLEENNGCWELCFRDGGNVVRRTQNTPVVCMDMREFTKLFFRQRPLYINDMV